MLTNEVPIVSIIIPCRNERKYISRCLDSIVSQNYPKDKLEILVVDGVSEDGTREIIEEYSERFPFVRLLSNPQKITPVAINMGIKEAKGEIIVRVSGHATYQQDHISKCLKYLEEYKADNVGGKIITVSRDNTFVGKAITSGLSCCFGVGDSYFRTGSKQPRWVDTVFGECCRRDVFDKIGFFNEKLVRGQDMEFSLRLKKAGYRTLLVPEILVYYHARSDFRSFLRHNFINGIWAVYPFKFSNVIPVSLRHLVPLVFVLSLAVTGTLSFLVSFFKWVFLGIIFSYCLANICISAKMALEKKDFRYLFFMPIVFATLHISYGLGSGLGAIKLLLPAKRDVL